MRLSRSFPALIARVPTGAAGAHGPMPARRRASAVPLLLAAAIALGAAGCAHLPWRHRPRTVIDAAAGPVAHSETVPPRDTTVAADTTKARPVPSPRPIHQEHKEEPKEEKAEPPTTNPPTPVQSVMTPAEAKQARERAVADSTSAAQALKKCNGRALLPDQESVYDTVKSLLAQVRAALQGGELWRAESLARKAKQLSSSLDCP